MIEQRVPEATIHQPEADVYFAASVEEDALTRRRLMRLLGSVAAESVVTVEHVAAEAASLPSVAEDYFSKDPERARHARARLRADLGTNTFEILCASGHISLSYSRYRDKRTGFCQNGYSQRAMYAHGTLHANHRVEHGRRTVETLNELRIEDGFVNGRFRTHYFVEASRAPNPEEMSDEVADEHGYDIETWKMMWRLTEVDAKGSRVTASAPVCGVDKSGKRRDAQGVQHVQDKLGLSPEVDSATSTIEGFWVRKELLPKRIVSLAELSDEAVCGEAFFGVDGQTGNYDTILEESLAREQQAEAELDSKVHVLALELQGASCMGALKIIARHAKDFAAELCGKDTSYDPAQFGPVAASYIEEARYQAMIGNEDASKLALEVAKATAIVYMCGMKFEAEAQADGTVTNKEADASGECEFNSKECPLCHKKDVKTRVTRTHIIGSCGCSKRRVPKVYNKKYDHWLS